MLSTTFPLSALIVLAAAAVALSGCSVADSTTRTESATHDATAVTRLVIDTDNGAVSIRGGDVDSIEVDTIYEEHDRGDAHSDASVEGDELVLKGWCDAGWFEQCGVGFRVVVPNDLEVSILTDNGRIELADLSGDIEATTDNGAIVGANLTGGAMQAKTDNGRIELAFGSAPHELAARTDNGRIELRLPRADGGYAVDATTDNGDVDISVPTDPDSDRHVTARTDNGAVAVRLP